MKILKTIFNAAVISLAILSLAQAADAKNLSFAVTSDINYLAEENSIGAKVLKGFVSRANENNYDFIVFNGDNIKKSKPQHLKGFLNNIQSINTPYYLVMGNSDVHKISGMAKPEYLKIVNQYSRYQKKEENSYYFYPSAGIIAIVLDGVSTGMPTNHGVFNKKTLQWLDKVLTDNKNKQAVIFQHVPYYEPVDIPEYEILDKAEYAAVLRSHKNVALIVSGHYGKDFEIKDDYGVTHISVPAMSEEPYYYTEIQIDYDKKPLGKAKNLKIERKLKPAV